MENERKQRNGCISFWLWVAIIANIAMVAYYVVTMFSAYSSGAALGLGLCSILGAVNVLSCILLLRWNKIGFYMMAFSSILAIVVNICVLKMEPVAMIGSLFAILIWWAILQMKKDGVSAWSQLQSGWDGKHCRHLYQLFGAIGVILFILTMIAFGNANGSDDDSQYEEVEVDEIEDDENLTYDGVEEVFEIPRKQMPDEIEFLDEILLAKGEFTSKDRQSFNLKGDVRKCKYIRDGREYNRIIEFDRNGGLVNSFGAEKIERKPNGYLHAILYDLGGETFIYDDNNMLTVHCTFDTSGSGEYFVKFYGSNPVESFFFGEPDYETGNIKNKFEIDENWDKRPYGHCVYEYIDFDNKGNWILRNVSYEDYGDNKTYKYKEKRDIVYY